MIHGFLAFLICVLAVFTGNVQSKADLNDFICSYPEALKTALESSIGKSCQQIQSQDLSQLDSLQFPHTRGMSEMDSSHFEHLPLLQALDFSSLEQLNHIPEFVYDLTSLKHLNISSTGIFDFDFRLCRLKELESFIGRNNTYKNNEIPFHTFCLENLKTLDMSNSGIVYIDEYLYYLQSLETLMMRDNALSLPPIVFPFLPLLKTVDFRGNTFLNKNLNTLRDCTKIDPEDVEECSADLKSDFDCEGYHRFTHNRGQPLRRYKAMTDQEFLELEIGGIQHKKSRCYQDWLIRQGGFDSFESTSGFDQEGRYKGRNSLNSHLLLRTINGKTVREWRLVLRLLKRDLTSGEGLPAFLRQPGDGFWAWEANGSAGYMVQLWRGFFANGCYAKRYWDNWIGVKDENHTPDEAEVFPEENIHPDFEERKEWKCEY